jgi:peptidoglycan/LPS O-acetylase OafA/YrhL
MRYRADIDGLRAIAILTVVAFHALPAAMPGGFIGVDIFFVISGYLISGIMLDELHAGRFSIRVFYGRRIRRIFAALMLVLAATLLVGRYVLFPDEMRELGDHTLAGAGFLANFALWRDTDYFDIEAVRKPLLHLWSLGIEEQFYIAWPLLLWLTRKSFKAAFATVLFVIVASFALNLVGIYVLKRETMTFYIPLTRIWELACGALLAVFATAYSAPGAHATEAGDGGVAHTPSGVQWRGGLLVGPSFILEGLACAGLGLLVAGLIVIDATQAFPGWRAVLPIGGAAALIAAGPATWINRVLLSNRVAVFIGLISFPLYLWHWPLLVFQALIWPESASARAAALGLAALLATLTYVYVERPIRFSVASRAVITRGLFVGMCVIAALGAMVSANHLIRPLPDDAARVLGAGEDWTFPEGPSLDRNGGVILRSIQTDRPDEVTLYIGDSHLQQYWSRLKLLSETRRPGMRSVELATYAGCPPLPGLNRLDRDFRCPTFFDQSVALADSDKVKAVVFAGWWEFYFLPQSPGGEVLAPVYLTTDAGRRAVSIDSPEGQAVLDRFGEILKHLVQSKKQVFVMLSNPTSREFNPLNMVERITYRVSVPSGIDRSAFERRAAAVTARIRAVAQTAGATVVDPVEFLCDSERCPARDTSGQPLYKDSNHLRSSFAQEQSYLDPFNY